MDGTVHRLVVREVTSKDIAEYTAVARGKTSKAKLIIQGEFCISINEATSIQCIYGWPIVPVQMKT